MDTKKLRQKILDLAIRGKLVPQDPNDEPASVLLERIRKEKERLIKEGKIKRSKQTASDEEFEAPFEIPDSWEWVKLFDIAVSELGKTLDKGKNTGFPHNYLCAYNVKWCSFDMSVTKKFLLEDNELERYKVRKGDLLICEGGDVGRAAIWESDDEIYYQNALHRVRFKDTITPYFYLYVLQHYKSLGLIDDVCGGVTIKHFTQNSINKLCFPLPPTEEQERIVTEIKQWFSLIDTLENAKEDLQASIEKAKSKILDLAIQGKLVPQDPNDEPASVLLQRIRKEKEQLKKKDLEVNPIDPDEIPFDIPESWEWVRLGAYTNKVTDFVASGSFASLRENVKYYNSKEYAILVRTKDFQTNFKTDLVYTDRHGYDFLENSNLFGGELILPNIGASIGKVFIVPKLDYRMTLAPNAVMIRFFEDCQRDWIYILFLSKFGKNLLYDISSSTAQGKFNKTDFKELVIPIPPLAEQKRIVAKIEELFAVLDGIRESIEK